MRRQSILTRLGTTVLASALLATGALVAPAVVHAEDAPPPRGSIHEETSRQAATEYRKKASKDRQTREALAADDLVRAQVVKRALAQVGDDYASGAEGPNAFDCSGLVVYAWRGVGIELTHYSRAQYNETERISLKEARPGDLAFYFENGAHHVAIYIGDGKVVHASDYGIGVVRGVVKGTPWTNTHFTGMGRVTIPR
jgi:cell wall-associated NlpC family hydrolase